MDLINETKYLFINQNDYAIFIFFLILIIIKYMSFLYRYMITMYNMSFILYT